MISVLEFHSEQMNHIPLPLFFVNVASKGLRLSVSVLESTLAGPHVSVDSK